MAISPALAVRFRELFGFRMASVGRPAHVHLASDRPNSVRLSCPAPAVTLSNSNVICSDKRLRVAGRFAAGRRLQSSAIIERSPELDYNFTD
jgi:hypothetical protein